jgi:aminopeptidase N
MQHSELEVIHLSDYQPPAFNIESVDLRFELNEDDCIVQATSCVRRNGAPTASLVLDGDDLELVSVTIDARPLTPEHYQLDEGTLTIHTVPDTFTLDIRTRIFPQKNTALEGLYRSGDMFCTQCEAEGFRKITFFLDRPDVMAKYSTTIVADQTKYPVLLSNGNATASGTSDDQRHWVTWQDPFPKPSYLFALVAGNLVSHDDVFTTRSGRQVTLRIFVEAHNIERCEHAMASLKLSMVWDEQMYGREYDLDIFMIVAVDAFNMGAMENKGLNIFNSKYVLANPASATDADYEAIESIIAHEYFHNWTGNRVTCRDWFQLSLKEGLTVFRDQEFTADTRSRALARIADVRILRTAQFREDAGPTAHPVRPRSYAEINNFYTVTVYNKGAEVVRMIHRLLGPDGFRAGMDLYFERHDGQAVTTEDFVCAMEDASEVDLTQFRRWYEQAGTPNINVSTAYDAQQSRYSVTLSQVCAPTADGSAKAPFHIPIAFGLIDAQGQSVALPNRSASGLPQSGDALVDTVMLELSEQTQTYHFDDITSAPVASILRGFSAPVRVRHPRDNAELAALIVNDVDEFNRWDASQTFAERIILSAIELGTKGTEATNAPKTGSDAQLALYLDALGKILADDHLDKALVSEILTLPTEAYLAEQVAVVDPVAIAQARLDLRRAIAKTFEMELRRTYDRCRSNEPYRFDTEPAARRALKNTALSYLMELEREDIKTLCEQQFRDADNMTDRFAALAILSRTNGDERTTVLAEFESQWENDPLVLDKWFALQADSPLPGTLDEVKRLMEHLAFDITNPNRVRALVGTFCHRNAVGFHDASGQGYEFLADQIIALDALNPQAAARLASAFLRWRRFDAGRQSLMEKAMLRIQTGGNLSKDCSEILSKTLNATQ